MLRVGVGMEEADADSLDAGLAEISGGRTNARLVQRAQLLTAEIQAPADLADVGQRHDALRLDPEIGVAVALWHRLPGNLEDVPEAGGDDQTEAGDLALQQRIRR